VRARRLGPGLPTGIFSNEQIDLRLAQLFSRPGRTNDFRKLIIHSRMALGMKHYERAYPGTDIVLIEPDHRDPELYVASTFSYGQRRHLAEHAYQQTRAMLRAGSGALGTKLARHGIGMRAEVLDDRRRRLVALLQPAGRVGEAMSSLRGALDDLGDALRPALRPAR
jgi:NTE family protein